MLVSLIAQAEEAAQPVDFTGPTGEANTLQLEARGVIECLLHAGAMLADSTASVAAALLAGNTVLVVPEPGAASIAERLGRHILDAGFPAEAIAVCGAMGECETGILIGGGAIAGVTISAGGNLAARASRALAQRDGPILPLLDDDFGADYLVRFFHEKTLSVNTTASGGNAALMSQGELD